MVGLADADLGAIGTPAQPTIYKYDVFGKMVEVIQGVQHRYFKYDALGRLLRVRQPEQEVNPNLATSGNPGNDAWTAGFAYDLIGNVVRATDANGVNIINEYDKAGRVVKRCYTKPNVNTIATTCAQIASGDVSIDTPAVSFWYDGKGLAQVQTPHNFAKGKLTKVTSSVSETQNTLFDNFGRITESKQITDGNTYTSRYTYNFAGALVEEEYPSGRIVKNEYESDGDIARIFGSVNSTSPEKTFANSFRYASDGKIESLRLGNGLWESAKFNSRMQPTEINLGHGVVSGDLWKLTYEYGELESNGNVSTAKNTGNVARQTVSFNGLAQPFVQSYKYDSLYRLTEAKEVSGTNSTSNWIQTFGYDRYGNRTATNQSVNGATNNTTPAIDPNTNRFTSSNYHFDKNGNLTKDIGQDNQSRTIVFNGDNKQTEVKDANGTTIAQYYFDGEGKRVKKKLYEPSAPSVVKEETIFVYSSGKLIAEYSTAPAPQNPTTNYTATDMLGSPRVLTNSLGEVVSRRDFLPFGEEILPDGANRTANQKYVVDGVRQKFTGYQKDEETGLDFAEARMYENRYGRFTAVDPLLASGKSANPQTFNRYVYVVNNPVAYTDPTGLQVATPKIPGGKWWMPKGSKPPVFSVEQPDGTELVLPDKNGELTYIPNYAEVENGRSDFLIRLNKEGPMRSMPLVDVNTGKTNPSLITDFQRNGWEQIFGDAYSKFHPSTGAVQDVSLETVLACQGVFSLARAGVSAGVARSFATAESEAIVYGGGNGAARTWAQAAANNSGRQTIEMTPGGKVLNAVTNAEVGGFSIRSNFRPLNESIWRWASGHYARGISGEVQMFRTLPVRPGNLLEGVELPILRKNPTVFIRAHQVPRCISP